MSRHKIKDSLLEANDVLNIVWDVQLNLNKIEHELQRHKPSQERLRKLKEKLIRMRAAAGELSYEDV